MGNNKVYRRLTSIKTDANSLLIFNLGNDASQIGKLEADDILCPFLCVQKNQPPCVNGQRQGCTTSFKTIVTVLVAMCALLILSAMKAIDLPVEIL